MCIIGVNSNFDPSIYDLDKTIAEIKLLIANRMFHDKVRKIHYTNPDKSIKYNKGVAHIKYPDMADNQHLNQKGHSVAGVRSTLRAPIPIRILPQGKIFTGVSDVRLFRSDTSKEFNTSNLFRVVTYSKWIKIIVEATFNCGYSFNVNMKHDKNLTCFYNGSSRTIT